MEVNHTAIIELELKYCERCGGLFLRRAGQSEVYCIGCAEQMVERPSVRRRSRPRMPVNPNGPRLVQLVRRAEGGNA